jgi:diaminohydroxyphosphoribosylaminopyrimidine deaminase/5-amino-6-(5-phosphoribosylamino)uracil reductase
MDFSRFDHVCMAHALRLARKGLFGTHPNPRVGCVIARQDRIVGCGWHRVAGGPHAEIEALRDAGSAADGATAFITLEPCNHHGRTPPCADALIDAGIARVVIATGDPNPLVNGGGAARLKAAGISLESGLMKAEAEDLNAGFFKRMREGLPWVRVKTAVSLDGRTAFRNGMSKWITSEESRLDVQRWRARSSAILTGIGTVLADDPNMNARMEGLVRQPVRVIADSHWRTPPGSKILAGAAGAVVFGGAHVAIPQQLIDRGVDLRPVKTVDGRVDLRVLLETLAISEINEVQVEAGAGLCGALLRDGLVDEVLMYQAPILMGDGAAGPFALGPLESMRERTHLTILETVQVGPDLRIRLRPRKDRSE